MILINCPECSAKISNMVTVCPNCGAPIDSKPNISNAQSVSGVVFSNSIGWFRYNYDRSRLEFLNNETKLVVQSWELPTDQWMDLPSQRLYCENIFNESVKQHSIQLAKKKKYKLVFIISSIITAILGAIDLHMYLNWNLTSGIISSGFIISFAIAATAYYQYKEV